MDAGLKANNIIFCTVISLMIISILAFHVHLALQCQKQLAKTPEKKKRDRKFLFAMGTIFDLISIINLFLLLFKAAAEAAGYMHNMSPVYFVPCHLVYLQMVVSTMLTFLRVHIIFKPTPFAIPRNTIIIFCVCCCISLTIFCILLTVPMTPPEATPWIRCATGLCIPVVAFFIWITTLFLSKVTTIAKADQNDQGLIKVITKTAILAAISMSLTVFSCLVLFFSASCSILWKDEYSRILSEWLCIITLYTNFVCHALSYSFYTTQYRKLCTSLDNKCSGFWISSFLSDKVVNQKTDDNAESTNAPSANTATSEAKSKDTVLSQTDTVEVSADVGPR